MLQDIQDYEPGDRISCDLCIAGGGAAGLTLARAFKDSRLSIVLLESGGLDYEARVQTAGVGANLNLPYYELAESRLRMLGGTTNIWGGRCTPLNEIDFQTRDWVPHSGWPIGMSDLRSGYERAHADLELGEFGYGDELWRLTGSTPPEFDRYLLDYCFWRFDRLEERFSASRCTDLFAAGNIRVVTHASVTGIQAAPSADRVEQLHVQGPAGRRVTVRARSYVLACGGIENARLLLASRGTEPNGVGNRHDQVGRYFMEHPHGRLGTVHTDNPRELWLRMSTRFPDSSVPVAPVLRAAPVLQRQRGLLNTAVTFKLQKNPRRGVALSNRLYRDLKHQLNPTRRNRSLWHFYKKAAVAYQKRFRPRVERVLVRFTDRRLCVMVRGEQAPDPESRVLLAKRRDRLGQPVADLSWRLSGLEKHTLRELSEVLDAELRRLDIGTFVPEPWIAADDTGWPVDATVGNHPIGGYHHMGTTRMSRDPRFGVVDADCRIHGYADLYVAGSSVFPTAGWANPTLTILALTYRLHDHLRRCLRG